MRKMMRVRCLLLAIISSAYSAFLVASCALYLYCIVYMFLYVLTFNTYRAYAAYAPKRTGQKPHRINIVLAGAGGNRSFILRNTQTARRAQPSMMQIYRQPLAFAREGTS